MLQAEDVILHVQRYPNEREIIEALMNDFLTTWACVRRAFNARLSIYFLRPKTSLKALFGFERELILAVPHFINIQPRTMQAINSFFDDDPARGRVDQTIFFIYSQDPKATEWVSDYVSENPQSRIPVVLTPSDICGQTKDQWHIRNVIAKQLYIRDLFDYSLPLSSDIFFFGRDDLIGDFIEAAKKRQNRGLFGLRKTGKTSLLFKIRRLLTKMENFYCLYYDCKLPSIRGMRWHDLLSKIMLDIQSVSKAKVSNSAAGSHVSDQFMNLVRLIPKKSHVVLVFDEVEYISPRAQLDKHWVDDFIPFWQTMWSAQSDITKVSFIISGVNPFVAETDVFDGVQNPLFGIVRPTFLRGLLLEDVEKMVTFFGCRMGLNFDNSAISYLFDRYGGHPLLTRLACSYIHMGLMIAKEKRPALIERSLLQKDENSRDSELKFYCRHIVSELQTFFPDEYLLLEMLATGQIVDFAEVARQTDWVRHIRDYGLVDLESPRPRFAIPVLGTYLSLEFARRSGAGVPISIVKAPERPSWCERRKKAILHSIRSLEKIVEETSGRELYGRHSIPEAERFASIAPCKDEDSFSAFITVCYRCFKEPVAKDKHLKRVHPDLSGAIERIVLYRNGVEHLRLYKSIEVMYAGQISADFPGISWDRFEDRWFAMQQVVIDNLLIAIECEIARYT